MECALYQKSPSIALSLVMIGFYELFGTMILLFGVNFMDGAAYGPAIALFIAINISGGISGGHHNPAVTMGVWTQQSGLGNNFPVLIVSWISQIAGAYLGAAISYGILGFDHMTKLAPVAGYSMASVFFVELCVTFLFVMIVLSVKISQVENSADGSLKCLTVALTLFACIWFAAHVSGGCVNSAVGLAAVTVGNPAALQYLWIYLLAPLCGGLLAGLFHRCVHVPLMEYAAGEAAGKKPSGDDLESKPLLDQQ